MMHDHEKSDFAIVATKPTNKAERSATESVEPRAETKRNASEQSTHRTLSRVRVSQALERVRKATSNTLGRQILKVGAVCLNWARTDLCGGRLATAVPTANNICSACAFPLMTQLRHPRLRIVATRHFGTIHDDESKDHRRAA